MSDTAPSAKDPAHLLVVDDEEIVLVALRQTLSQLGYRVTTACDAGRALGYLQEHDFAAVISDHQMPALTGLEFLAQVREVQPDASRVPITAVLNLSTVIDAINKAEIFRFLIKPWEREELLSIVRSAVERYQGLRARKEMLTAALRENQSLQARVQALEADLERSQRNVAP